MKYQSKKSFTLVELMIVIAILAILSAIVIFALNPARLFDNFRDTRRVSDINTINRAINFIETWNTDGIAYGSTTTVYISLPDTSSTCSSYTLPVLPTGYTYSCKTIDNYRKTDSNGWIPIDFSIANGNSYIPILPVDPVNDTTYFYTYYSGGSYEVTALLKNPNTNSINDDDSLTGAFTVGSPNRSWNTPLSRDTNLVLHLKFNEEQSSCSGSANNAIVADFSGFNNQGTIFNANWFQNSSTSECAVDFLVGQDSYIRIDHSNSLNLSSRGTIVVWFYQRSQQVGCNPSLIQKGTSNSWSAGRYNIFWHVTEKRFYGNHKHSNGSENYVGFPSNLELNKWHQIVFTWDGLYLKSYTDGYFSSQNNQNIEVPTDTSNIWIGKSSNSSFDGYIDDVRIYNRGLSANEISEIYNKTKSKYQ